MRAVNRGLLVLWTLSSFVIACNLSFLKSDVAVSPTPPSSVPATSASTVVPASTESATSQTAAWMKDKPPTFDDFPISGPVFKGVPAPVDISDKPTLTNYKSLLDEAAKTGPNFAGHYTVVELPCGTSCGFYPIVDAVSGSTYQGVIAERGIRYALNSTLVIANLPYPPDLSVSADEPQTRAPVSYFVWDGKQLQLIFKETCTVVNSKHVCGNAH